MTLPLIALPPVLLRVAPVVGGMAIVLWRIQETRSAVTARKIVLPPLAMSTGFAMFAVPAMRIPWTWGVAAFLLGALVLALPLLRSSELERCGDEVLMRRSKGFLLILLGLLGVRLALHEYVGALVSGPQTASVFFVMAFGMIVRWRARMYRAYRTLQPTSAGSPPAG